MSRASPSDTWHRSLSVGSLPADHLAGASHQACHILKAGALCLGLGSVRGRAGCLGPLCRAMVYRGIPRMALISIFCASAWRNRNACQAHCPDSLFRTCGLCVIKEPRSSKALLLAVDCHSRGPTSSPLPSKIPSKWPPENKFQKRTSDKGWGWGRERTS